MRKEFIESGKCFLPKEYAALSAFLGATAGSCTLRNRHYFEFNENYPSYNDSELMNALIVRAAELHLQLRLTVNAFGDTPPVYRCEITDYKWDGLGDRDSRGEGPLPVLAVVAAVVKYQQGRTPVIACDECEDGRWYDASHGASRTCNKCRGTGKL